MTYAVEIDNLKKKFSLPLKPHEGIFSFLPKHILPESMSRDFWALDDVSFKIEHGKMLGFIGLNGSGKSTLLKILAGILTPTSGTVRINGLVAALLELGAGFHEELSGMENIFLNGAILGLTKARIMDVLPSIIDFSGLGDFIYTPIKHYSSGMQARLGFSIAVNLDPDILIIDEVMSVGDLEFQSKCMEKIAEFRRKNKTILLVTHEIDIASYLCDDLLWLEKGKVRAIGPSVPISHDYRAHVLSKSDLSIHPCESPDAELFVEKDLITEIRFLDENSSEKLSFDTNRKMTIEVSYDTYGKKLEKPEIEIWIERQDKVKVTHIKSSENGKFIDTLEGKGKINIHLNPMYLLKGHYEISFYIYLIGNPNIVYARRIRKDFFEVATEGFHNPVIVAALPSEWTLRKA
jgi:ABC-type polysaccharide/polyol phosphate transport system ATPase subunit